MAPISARIRFAARARARGVAGCRVGELVDALGHDQLGQSVDECAECDPGATVGDHQVAVQQQGVRDVRLDQRMCWRRTGSGRVRR